MAASGGGSKNQNPGKETPEDWSRHEDARKGQGAGEYPNQMVYKSRSGHSLIFDDSQGHESVTLQHRSGSVIQMQPDGAVHITAHNSLYTVVFGENRMTVSGAQDITVKGDASLRVYGDMNTTVHKNYNLTVLGDYNVTAKNHNRHIRGNIDTQAKNETKKLEGSSAKIARGGIAHVATGSISNISAEGKSYMGGAKGAHIAVTKQGDMTFKNEKGDTFMQNADGKFDAKFEQGGKKVSLVAKSGSMKVQAQQDIGMESTSGSIQAKTSSGDISVDSGKNASVKARAAASVKGATTHVGDSTGTTHVVGGDVNVDPLAGLLNLAGGMGLPFDISQLSQFTQLANMVASGIPSISSSQADQPREEPDAENEISNWL